METEEMKTNPNLDALFAQLAVPFDLREISDPVHGLPDARQQPQPVFPERRFVAIDGDFVEEIVNRAPQPRQFRHHFLQLLA